MPRYAWTLMVPMFLGCSGANVVSGEDQTAAESFASGLPSWCEKTCNRLSACDDGGRDCDCSGDVCNCTTQFGDDCPEECEAALADLGMTTEQCADVGTRYKSCVDSLTCAELDSEPPCLPSRDELAACDVDDGDDEPPQGTGGTSSTDGGPSEGGAFGGTGAGGISGGDTGGTGAGGFAGTASGGSGTAGMPSVGPLVTCGAGSGSGSAGSANLPSGAYVTCQETRAQCSDGHEYDWICVDDSNGHSWCTCFLDNSAVGALPSSTGICPSVVDVNAACGWNLSTDF